MRGPLTSSMFLGNHCKFQWFWRDHCKFSMVFEETITIECFLGGLTIAINGFTMFFWCCYHRFQWFFMVPDHWSNDAMVSMDRCGLHIIEKLCQLNHWKLSLSSFPCVTSTNKHGCSSISRFQVVCGSVSNPHIFQIFR